MLHKNPLMVDIDVEHWRNLQELILESGKEKRRIILIHENGELQKFVHSDREEIIKSIEKIADPQKDAEKVFNDNRGKTDFVMVLERRAVEQFFAEVQDSWQADEDLDEYVHRMVVKLDEYPKGIVTYPGPARTNLGLQWRLGASYEEVKTAVDRFVVPNSTVIFGVFKEDKLWASLILGFDRDNRITLITTADQTEIAPGQDWKATSKRLVQWAEEKYSPCSLGLFLDLDSTKALLASRDKLTSLRESFAKGKLVVTPLPEGLEQLLKAA